MANSTIITLPTACSENGRIIPRSRLLEAAARRLEANPWLAGYPLASYRQRTRLTEAQVAAELECTVPALHALALCRRPAATADDFELSVREIAAVIGCAAEPLARLLRQEDPRLARLEAGA